MNTVIDVVLVFMTTPKTESLDSFPRSSASCCCGRPVYSATITKDALVSTIRNVLTEVLVTNGSFLRYCPLRLCYFPHVGDPRPGV